MLQPKNRLSRAHVILVGILGLAEFARGALIVSLLPAFVTGPLGAPITIVGWALSSHYFLDTVFRGPSGWLVDRIGPPRVLTIGVAVEILALIGAMNTHSPDWVIVFVAILGIGTATHWPAVVTGTNRLTASDRRASVMGLVFAAWLTGAGLGPVLINFLLQGRDRTAFLVLIMADLLAFSLTVVVYDPRLFQIHETGNRVHHWFKTLKPFRAVLPGMFVQNMTMGVMLPILQPFVSRVLHFSHWQFAELLVGSGALTVVLLVPMGRFTDRFGIKVPLIVGFFLAGGSLTAVGLLRDFCPVLFTQTLDITTSNHQKLSAGSICCFPSRSSKANA